MDISMKIYSALILPNIIAAQCTWPSQLISSTWNDNAQGELAFGETTMSGWSFEKTGQVIDEWQCTNVDQFDTDGYLVMRSVSDFIQFVTSRYYAYLCLKMTEITPNSYRYYIFEPQQPEIGWDRYLIHAYDYLNSVEEVCYEAYGASGAEYRVMIKSGSESSAGINCPWVFLGSFDYLHTPVSGTTSCSATGDSWSMCTDTKQMTFDYNSCPVDVAYSGSNTVTCVDTVPEGTEHYVTVYNSGGFDGVNSFQFTCFAINDDLTTVSVAPGYCRHRQTSTDYPVDTSQNNPFSNEVGALIEITAVNERCLTCPELEAPDGGTVNIETNGAMTTATYTCDTGYALYGESTRSCQENNTWTSEPPTCKCEAPGAPDNGNVEVSYDGTIATYSCDLGYVLKGNQHRGCQADGNAWNGTEPICETCSTLGMLENGSVNYTSQDYSTIAIFTCDVGYSLAGAVNITCLDDGTWSDTLPDCIECVGLILPSLGNIILDSNGTNTFATFSCDTGYKVHGTDVVTCTSDGSWETSEPSCICDDPEQPANGDVGVTGDGLTATYTCDLSFTMDGENTRECLLNGTSWTGNVPICTTCDSMQSPTGGNFTMTTNGTHTTGSVSCLPGYTIQGEVTIKCNSDGTWTQNGITCVECDTIETPTSGNVTITTNGSVSIAEYTCSDGYILVGSSIRQCGSDGVWDSEPAVCDCEDTGAPLNGYVTVIGDTRYYTCTVNYTLSGAAESVCGTDDSGLSSQTPECVACQELQVISGGTVLLLSDSGLFTKAMFSCDVGYTLVGTNTTICDTDGTWDNAAPYCQVCEPIDSPDNGMAVLTTDGSQTVVQYSCDVGFTVNDLSAVSSQCEQDGTWSVQPASCVACETIGNISSGSVSLVSNGTVTTAMYSCMTGYQLIGDGIRTCNNNGTWSLAEPQCQCEMPSVISNGEFLVSLDGMSATYMCNTGYSMDGSSYITCQDGGLGWNGTSPSCVTCETLTGPSNGMVSLSTDGSSSFATYTCDLGYSLDGTTLRTCLPEGSWTEQPPNCILCDTLSSPDSGFMVQSFNITTTLATFDCVTGYHIVGDSVLSCNSDGTWNDTEPTCVCDAPLSPANGSISLTDSGMTVMYHCDVGFTLNGDNSRTCQTQGMSWSGTIPSCVMCDPLADLSSGLINYSSNGTVTEVTFGCNIGYTLATTSNTTLVTSTAECNENGEWNAPNLTCVKCEEMLAPNSGSFQLITDGITTEVLFECTTEYFMVGSNSSVCNTLGAWTSSPPSCVCMQPTTTIEHGSVNVSSDNMTLTYSCDPGYTLSGSSTRNCSIVGNGWSGNQPTCGACDSLTTPVNGGYTLISDGIVTKGIFTCDVNSTMDGVDTLTCGTDGSWDHVEPECIQCPDIVTPYSGSVSLSTNGTLTWAEFSCVSDYQVIGNDVIMCYQDGTWSGSEPTCVCNTPVTPTDGNISLSSDGMTVYYQCDVGFTISGNSSRQCSTSGTGWQGTDPTCVSCPPINAPVGGTLDLTSDGTQTAAYFTCDLGFTIDGLSSISCDSGAVWSDDTPSCVQCQSLNEPDSGSIAVTTDGEQTVATYSCVNGYTLSGQTESLCQSDGAWSDNSQACVCTPPSTPDNGYISISDNGTIVTYMCMAWYSLKGVDTRVCQSDGAGWNENQPSCVTCDPLTNPTGATINTTTSGTVTVAYVTCDTGYTIDGSSTLTCRSDGSWDISIPTCNVCGSLTVSTGGTVDMFSVNSVTKANFSCNVGYSLSGVSLLTCRTDGNWDFTEPVCVKCEELLDVNSGNITLTTDGVTSQGFVKCEDGYHIVGQSELLCSADGTWDDDEPLCVCDAPNVPSNGSYVQMDGGMTMMYSCDTGFTLVGEYIAMCSDSGTGWNVESPVCDGCPSLPTVANGTTEMTSNGITTTWSVSCSIGTSISVAGSLTCTDNGTWSFEQPTCVSCPIVAAPENGDVAMSTDGDTSMATFNCDIGYSLDGTDSATCLNNGTWSDSSPQCFQCDAISMISSGDIEYSTNGTHTTASFTCNQGYYVDGNTNIICEATGLWDAYIPSCVCEPPPSPVNGSLWISDDGMSLKYYCQLGFTLSGQSNNTCQQDGTGWMSDNPTCVQCQSAYNPLNGELTIYTDGETTYAILTCGSGYSLNTADNVLTCDQGGIWSTDSVECVKCDDLDTPDSGFLTVSTNGSRSEVTYSCMTGYYLLGTSEGHCLTNGSWDHSQPSCVCDSPTSFANGQVTVSSDLQTAYYSCNTGFALNGITDRYCADDGTGWSGQEPSCVSCNTLDSVSGGSVQMSSDGMSTYANYTCAAGFSMNGESSVACRSDGTWNWNPPTCELCPSLVTDTGGSYIIYTDGLNTQVTFECDVGYTMVGSLSATCSSTGSWSSTEPTCVSCQHLDDLNSGAIEFSTNGSVTSAVFTCSDGYYIVGEPFSYCQVDGSWNTTLPVCVCDIPSTPVNGSITISEDGFNVVYTCDTGFVLKGDAYLECGDDGSGWNGTVPECKQCEAVSSPNNGTVLISSDGQQTVVSVTCDQGFSSSGTSTLTCLEDGSYDFSVPVCVGCQTISSPSSGSITQTTNGTQTLSTMTCDLGYTLQGVREIQCLQDGSWTDTPASCEPCQTFPAVSSGSYNMTTNGSVTYTTISCTEGYILSGPNIVYCSDTGEWSGTPSCDCVYPEAPINGQVISTGLIATFTCDSGFSLDGSPISVCGADGEGWLTASPVCVQCEPISDMNVGESTLLSDTSSQTYIQYTCPVGYTLDGQEINYCHTNGSWLEPVPTCVECAPLLDPSSGAVSLQTDNVTSTAWYSCVEGYELDGTDTRVCNSDGTWTLFEPICVCSHPGTPDNGNVTITTDHVTATYTCDSGYTISGSTTRICAEDGSGWSGTQPSCVLCDTLTTPSGGSVTIATDGRTTTATFTCTQGFTKDGASSIMCRNDGSWNTSIPSCVICESLQTPTNGEYTISTTGDTSVATFTCDQGYTLQGSPTLSCNVAGKYDREEPACSACTALVTPDSATMVTSTNGTVTSASFSCLSGYYMSGDSELTCYDDGTWDKSEPDCYCEQPSNISNGYFNISMDNLSVIYVCMEGYTLDGSASRLCQTNGLGWHGATPSCVLCDTLPTLENGTVQLSTNGSVTTASAWCVVGSVLVGEPFIECTSTGLWTEPTLTCVTCDKVVSPTNGNISLRTNGTTTLADVTCSLGYTLSGSPTLTCLDDGTWSNTVPACVPCLTLDGVDNGDDIISSDGQITSMSYSCHSGYDLFGADILSCRVDGTWNDSVPFCVCNPPLMIVDGNYTIHTDGMVVEYVCDVGYSMVGESERFCTTNSTGWTGDPPSCTKCDELPAPADGSLAITSDGWTSTVLYSCNLGYSLYGTPTGTCDHNGYWNLSTPACIQCPELDGINNGDVLEFTNGSVTMATYTCVTEYILEGNSNRYCQDGTWLGTEPTCLCSSSTFFQNGDVQSNGTVIIYSCDVGYSLNGTNTRFCEEDGTGWSLDEPMCEKCDTLLIPSGGSVNISTDSDTTTANFSCSLGYTMSGSPTLTCSSDGSWNLSPPSCGSSCSALGSPDNGEVALSSNGYITVASFTCEPSYSLKGSSLLTCRNDGSWDFLEPSCEQCSELSAPANGYMDITTDGSVSMARFSCHDSYYLIGEEVLYCASSEQWNSSVPKCVCIPPSDISNGYMNISEDGIQIIYSCISGYTLSGNSTITCQDNFLGWTANDAQCVTCGGTPELENGTVTMVTDGLSTSIQFTCDTGYSIQGQTVIECGSNGTWINELPECISCPELYNISNGSMNLQSDGYTTTAHYSCDLGYTLQGSVNISCLSNVTWNNLPPSCVACDILQDLSSGYSNQFTDGYNTYTELSCVSGYHLEGNTVLQCLSDGMWNSSLPTCVCDAPAIPNNGALTFSSDDTIIQYSCQTGYSLNGDVVRGCYPDRSGWNGTDPSCVSCPDVAPLRNGSSIMSTEGSVSVIQFSCEAGYSLRGETTLTCNSSGYWSGEPPDCVVCEDLVSPPSGSVTVSTNGTITMASYTCDTQYYVVGDDTRICYENGSWSSHDPQCACSNPSQPVDGHMTSDGYTAIYTCDIGYALYGEYIRLCQNDSSGWNGTEPTCVACEALHTPAGGNVTMETNGIITSATFYCDTGYTMGGTNSLQCRSDGTWDFTAPTCIPCDTLSVPNNGDVTQLSSGSITQANYSCDAGYTLYGVPLLTCRSSGTWDYTESYCVVCDNLEMIESGTTSTYTNGVSTYVGYTCEVGYYLVGETQRLCDSDGTWPGSKPACKCTPPATPDNGTLSLTNDNDTALFTCNLGYTMLGSEVLVCNIDGSGWNGSTPQCVSCGAFTEPLNGTVTYATDGLTSSVTLSCEVGTSLTGTQEIECGPSGTWEILAEPECVTCPQISSPENGTVQLDTNGTITQAKFTCSVGTSIDGLTEIHCENGTWSGSIPTCEMCPSIQWPSNSYSSLQLSTNGYTTTLTVTCVPGYSVVGNSTIECHGGSWDGSIPSCVCDPLSAPINGEVQLSDDLMNVVFSCDAGYTLNGSETSACSENGTGWSTDVPECILCSPLGSIGFGSLSISTNGTQSYIQYTCDVGYTLNGTSERYCGSSGQWSDTDPTCVACQNLTAPSSGYVHITTDNLTSKALYSCMSGYTINGTTERTCLSDGLWTFQDPICYCELPTTPLHGNVEYGVSVDASVFTCEQGYTLKGYQKSYCQPDGSGWNTSVPECVLCETLTLSAGVVHTVSTDGEISVATFECEVGYTMQGEDTLTCRDDGTWNVQEPTCVTCDTITPPSGGNINMTTYSSITQAVVSCDIGYTLVGAPTLTCRSDGSWDFSTPSCVSCPEINSLDSGNINMSTDGSQTHALFVCDTGYYIAGEESLTCGIDGTWSDQIPACKCQQPDTVDNGNLNMSDDGISAVYVCDVGFSMNGLETLVCQSNGLGWDQDAPICVQCDTGSTLSNGTMNIETNGTTTNMLFTCDSGFTLSGSTKISCTSTGQWMSEVPTCVQCQDIMTLTNGSFSWSTDGVTSEAVFECSTGYSLSGTTSITCSSSGILEGDPPSCVICPELTQPGNGKVTVGTNGTTTYAVYECDADYSIIGNEQIVCIDGTWNAPSSYCECSNFLKPSDGNIELSVNGSVAIYSCDVGFSLSGESVQICGSQSLINPQTAATCTACETLNNTGVNVNITTDGSTTLAMFECEAGYTMVGQAISECRSDGSWSASAPSCVSCETLDVPVGGKSDISTDGVTTYASIECSSGYTLSGIATVSCKTDGQWDYSIADCVKCQDIASPSAGNVTFSSNGSVTIATYACYDGYYTTDETTTVCEIDGSWTSTTPTCVCDPPNTIQNGTWLLYDAGMTVSYVCDVGFSLQGETIRYCDTDGIGWSDDDPTCNICPELLDQTNGSVTVQSDGILTTVSFTCEQGYSLSGSNIVECLPNGTWSTEQPYCELCDVFEEIANGSVSESSNGTQSVLSYTCDSGFTLVGSPLKTCLHNGTWDSITPSCAFCPHVEELENGEVMIQTNGTVTIAAFKCNENYMLIGGDVALCTVDGEWDEVLPSCVCSTFASLENGDTVITDNGTQAIYTCDTGFTLSGEAEQVCGQLTVTGETPTVPVCSQCESLSISSDLSAQLVTDGATTTAILQCPSGSSINGMGNITCRNDGTWDFAIPFCEPCATLSVSVGGNVSMMSDGQTTTARFSCDTGFTLSGQNMLSCNANGLWNYVEPTCVQCPSLSDPDSGSVNVSTDGETTIAVFECYPGYYIDGATILTCQETGDWDGSLPLCICDPPEEIANGEYTTTNNGMTVVYSCALNYTMDGNDTHYCDSEGGGFLGDTPTCSACMPLSEHIDGTVTLTTDGTVTMAEFICEEGYTLSGSALIQCQPNGMWNSATQPSCEKCSSLNDIDNGTFIISTNGTSTFADYSCDNGFTLSGALRRVCSDDGSWSDDTPICVLCDAMEEPENGIVTMVTNGSVSVVSFKCNRYFILSHEDDLHCTDSGAWTSSPPSCVCSTFGQPEGGNIVVAENGTKAIYSCEMGTTLAGESEQVCGIQTSTGDDLTVPTCVTCDTLSSSTVATFELSSDGSTTVARYQCPPSYTMIGTSNVTCRTDGTWDVSPPTCESCSTLSVFTDGSVNIVSDGEQSQALFACDPGSTLSGENMLTCTADGSWNFEQPICVNCPTLSTPQNGNINISTDGSISTALYTCLDDYYLDGEEVLTCSESELWDFVQPTCKCIAPADLSNGTHTVSTDGVSVSYTCNVGYSLHGDSVRYCGTDGTGWSGEQPGCVQCLTFLAGTDQSFNMTSDGITTFAHFYCDVGTWLAGEQMLSCLSDGTWSNDYPVCVSCPDLSVEANVKLTLESDGSMTVATFECDVGFTLVGDMHTECSSSDTWSGSAPSCVECPSLSHPNNGAVYTTYNGSITMATFTCHDGYSLVGYPVIDCLPTGNWSETVPTCECDAFSVPLDGNIEISDDGTTAMYTCDIGYSMNGESLQTCITSGSTASQPACVSCDSVSTSPGLTLNTTTDGQSTVAVFTCETGYTLIGNNILTCRSDGSWNYDVPICVSCDTLGTPVGGSVTLQSDGASTTASISCVEGFTLVGESLLTCKDDGSWDFDIPFCECNRPDTPDNGYISVSADSRTVSYHCASGFTMSGPSERYCAVDGTWWSDVDPVCVQCPALTSSAGMNISFIHNDNVAQAMFGCDVGYSLSHNENVSCLNTGSWSTTIPTCVKCASLNTTDGLSFDLNVDSTSTQAVFSCANNYDLIGAQSIACLQDGSWSMSQPHCVQTTSTSNEQKTCEAAGTSAAIAFGVLFGLAVIAILILAVILWRFWRRNKRLDGLQSVTYKEPQDGVKDNPLFTEIDRSSFIPSRAPLDYTRHITDLGRADSSLAPTSHQKHVLGGGAFRATPLSAPLSTRNIKLHNPPTRPPTIGGRRSPVISITPSSLRDSSLDDYLPDQLLTLREDTSVSSAVLEVPKLIYSDKKSKRADREKTTSPNRDQSRKSSDASLFFPVEEEKYREGSPLPQQILTPRNTDDAVPDKKARRGREKKPKDDLIDQDRNLLKIYNQKGKRSAGSGSRSPKSGNVSVTNIDHDIRDIDV